MPDVEKPIGNTPAPQPLRAARSALVQLHLWMRPEDVLYLRQVAAERDQTVSAVVRSIVGAYRRSRAVQVAQPIESGGRDDRGTGAVRQRYIRP